MPVITVTPITESEMLAVRPEVEYEDLTLLRSVRERYEAEQRGETGEIVLTFVMILVFIGMVIMFFVSMPDANRAPRKVGKRGTVTRKAGQRNRRRSEEEAYNFCLN